MQAWYDWNGFIDDAKDSLSTRWGRGLYIDLHGHGHAIQRLELGYLLTSAELGLTDEQLVAQNLAAESSIRALALSATSDFAEILRGPESLGALLVERGYASVPTPWALDPGGAAYFSGGFNTLRHGSRNGGTVSAIQIECYYTGVRTNDTTRAAFASALVSALRAYFEAHYGFTYTGDALPVAEELAVVHP